MTDLLIDDASAWALDNWGAACATYRVRLGGHEPQSVVARIEASTLANAALPDEGFDAIVADVDAFVRESIGKLASSGRVSPELVLSPVDVDRVLGVDPTASGDEPSAPEAQEPEEAEALADTGVEDDAVSPEDSVPDEPGATVEPEEGGSDAPSDDPTGGSGDDPADDDAATGEAAGS